MDTTTSFPSTPTERGAPDVVVGWHAKRSKNGLAIAVDGAVGYRLRLIPPNTILGRFAAACDAWPAVLKAIEAGRSPRTLVLDWLGADGSRGIVAGGATLEYLARSGLGVPADHLRR